MKQQFESERLEEFKPGSFQHKVIYLCEFEALRLELHSDSHITPPKPN